MGLLSSLFSRDTERKLNHTLRELVNSRIAFNKLMREYNELVTRINEKGGEDFLRRGVLPGRTQPPQLTLQEVNRLLSLCHPDRHGGSPAANDATVRLLALRKSLSESSEKSSA